MKRWRQPVRHALVALAFFTRIPIPAWVGYEADDLNRAAPWFPVVGLLIGLLVAGLFWAAQLVWPARVALVLSLIGSVLLTGAFHEDGLADSVDGMGGGYTREDVLRIMHDSRIGSFGALALILAVLLKLEVLAALPVSEVFGLLIAAHAASRWWSGSLLCTLDYVRPEGKAKPLATRLSWTALGVSGLAGLLPLIWLNWQAAACSLLLLWLVRRAYARWLVRRIGGYTGDTLGMAQQGAELLIYLTWLAWHSI